MRQIYIANVGDGLCISLDTISDKIIQVDCGSQDGSEIAFEGWLRCNQFFMRLGNVFILSHFHIDHYNGLLYASYINRSHNHSEIKEVYYPGLPEFTEKKDFMYSLFAMNLRSFGSETGIMEYDFLKAISKINSGHRFKYRAVFKDDIINIGDSVFKVLWPPRTVKDDTTTISIIKKALKDFKKALTEDVEIGELYERVKKEGVFEDYFKRGREGEPDYYSLEENEENNRNFIRRSKSELPEAVKEANKSLKEAANHLSLALFEDNKLLFLADTENFEIRQIINGLKSSGTKNFYIFFITPHHGTHWDDSLKEIKCIYSISSNGGKLYSMYSKIIPHFKKISFKDTLATHVNGDIFKKIAIGNFLRLFLK